MKWDYWITLYLQTHCTARGLRHSSIESYRATLLRFREYARTQWADRSPDQITAREVLEFLDYLRRERDNGAAAINRQVTVLRNFYRAMVALGHLEPKNNPLAYFPKIKAAPRKLPVTLNADEVRRLIELPSTDNVLGLRDRAMLTLLYGTGIRSVGLCHSVQGCAKGLLRELGIKPKGKVQWHIAGINHQAWLLEITDDGKDLYPLIKKTAARKLAEIHKAGGGKKVFEAAQKLWFDKQIKWWEQPGHIGRVSRDMVRLTTMLTLGYYITESSEHSAEYMPYWIKKTHPELIDEFNIPLDEYPRRCINQIAHWKKRSHEVVRACFKSLPVAASLLAARFGVTCFAVPRAGSRLQLSSARDFQNTLSGTRT
jgi:integrase